MKRITLVEKWTVSRGYGTYGYNICSLWLREGFGKPHKVASCNGGGYDMQGTVLGEYLQDNYQDRLLKLFETSKKDESHSGLIYATDFYGMAKVKTKGGYKISLDGTCGLSSIENIGRAIGLEFSRLAINKNQDLITITDNSQEG